MRPIGGYFSLELSQGNGFIHQNGLFVASCRNALELILKSLLPIKCIYVPFYTCSVVLEPIKKMGLKYKQYHINGKFEICDNIILSDDDLILYTNYWGIKDKYVFELSIKYKDRLIVDNAQALFASHIEGTSSIYSPRKFVGVPDGGIAYFAKDYDVELKERDFSYDRCSHLLKRLDVDSSFGYPDFRENANKLAGLPPRKMSNLTEKLMLSFDYESIKQKRIENFLHLHSCLCLDNIFQLPDISEFECPMVYPYWTKDSVLKQKLIDKKIYVATYWPNVISWCQESDLEYHLANEAVYLPIDQRYGIDDMDYIIETVKSFK